MLDDIRSKVEAEREDFLKAIAENPSDIDLRLRYRNFLAKYGLIDEYRQQALNLIELFIELGKYDAAKLELERLMRMYPEEEEIYRKLIFLYRDIDEFRDESKVFHYTQKLANILVFHEKAKEALEYLEELIKANPDSLEVKFAIARVYKDEGNITKALFMYEDIAQNAERKGDYDTAIKARTEIRMLQPDNISNLQELARYYEQKQQYKLSLSEYRHILRYDTQNLVALEGMGRVSIKLGEYNQARLAYAKLHKLVPDNPEYMFNLGIIYQHLKNKREAIKYLEMSAQRYSEGNFIEKAIEVYEKLLMLDPSNSSYRRALNELTAKLKEIQKVQAAEAQAEEISETVPSEDITTEENADTQTQPEMEIQSSPDIQEVNTQQTSEASEIPSRNENLSTVQDESREEVTDRRRRWQNATRRGNFIPKDQALQGRRMFLPAGGEPRRSGFLRKDIGPSPQPGGKPTLGRKALLVRSGMGTMQTQGKPLLQSFPRKRTVEERTVEEEELKAQKVERELEERTEELVSESYQEERALSAESSSPEKSKEEEIEALSDREAPQDTEFSNTDKVEVQDVDTEATEKEKDSLTFKITPMDESTTVLSSQPEEHQPEEHQPEEQGTDTSSPEEIEVDVEGEHSTEITQDVEHKISTYVKSVSDDNSELTYIPDESEEEVSQEIDSEVKAQAYTGVEDSKLEEKEKRIEELEAQILPFEELKERVILKGEREGELLKTLESIDIPSSKLSEYLVLTGMLKYDRKAVREEFNNAFLSKLKSGTLSVYDLSDITFALAVLSWPSDIMISLNPNLTEANLSDTLRNYNKILHNKLNSVDLDFHERLAIWSSDIVDELSSEVKSKLAQETLEEIYLYCKRGGEALPVEELDNVISRCLNNLESEEASFWGKRLALTIFSPKLILRYIDPESDLSELPVETLKGVISSIIDATDTPHDYLIKISNAVTAMIQDGKLEFSEVTELLEALLYKARDRDILTLLVNNYLKIGNSERATELLKNNLELIDEENYCLFKPLLRDIDDVSVVEYLAELERDPIDKVRYLKILLEKADEEKALNLLEKFILSDELPLDAIFLYRILEDRGTSEDNLKKLIDNLLLKLGEPTTRYDRLRLGLLYMLRGEYSRAENIFQKVFLERESSEPLAISAAYLLFAYAIIDKYLRGKATTSILIPKKSLDNANKVISNLEDSLMKRRIILALKYLRGILSEFTGDIKSARELYNELSQLNYWDSDIRLKLLESRTQAPPVKED